MFPIPPADRPVLFELDTYVRRLDGRVELTPSDVRLLEALGYTLVLSGTLGGPPESWHDEPPTPAAVTRLRGDARTPRV